jgi:SAM-dependent methyltransferase
MPLLDPHQRNQARKFHWVSSRTASPELLDDLQNRMVSYYSTRVTRDRYQHMLDTHADSQPHVLASLLDHITQSNPNRVIEIGCGAGWMCDKLVERGLSPSSYTGVELSEFQIQANARRIPLANWVFTDGYQPPVEMHSFDVAFSYFVIEHCVHPEKHLDLLLRLVRPGGRIYLVCPDFPSGGIFPSQLLGIAEGSAKSLLKSGRLTASLVGLYDSRFRLRRAMNQSHHQIGPFVINLNPRCLIQPEIMMPDVDAVYMSSRKDLKLWASANNLSFRLPSGDQGPFHSIALVELSVPNPQ